MTQDAEHLVVHYAFGKAQPAANSADWKPVTVGDSGESEIRNELGIHNVWVRVASQGSRLGAEGDWAVYGPLKGDDYDLDITPMASENGVDAVQFAATKTADGEKGLRCCRVRVRVRVVVRTPRVTVNNPVPEVTVRWRGPIPNVTVDGPDIIVTDLPRLPTIDSPIPTDGTPNVGMDCQVHNGEAKLWIQNGESAAVDVWLIWKDMKVGPIRMESKTRRSLGGTAISSCEIAKDAIYITRAKFV